MHAAVDVHTNNSTDEQAIGLMYAEALQAGCGTYSREAWLSALGRLGAELTISYQMGRQNFTLQVQSKKANETLKFFECMLRQPKFDAKELKRISLLLQNQLKQHEEEAAELATEQLRNALFSKTDRRWTSSPSELRKAVASVSKRDLLQYHQRVLTEYWRVTVNGSNIFVDTLEQKLSQSLSKPHSLTKTPTQNTSVLRKKLYLNNIPSKQNIEFSLGSVLPITLHHPDYPAFNFALNVLAKWGGFTGRLMSTVREKEGLTYMIYGRTETVTGDEICYWRIATFFSPQDSIKALASTVREIKLLHKKGISKDEHMRFCDILSTQQALLSDSVVRAVGSLHGFHIAGFTIDEMDSFKQRSVNVTLNDVNRVIGTYFDLTNIVISGAGPVQAVKKSLHTHYKNGIL